MRRERHIHPEELISADLLSEALLIGSMLLVFAFLFFVLMHAST